MKHKLNFATWWPHLSQSIKNTKIAPPDDEIKFVFHRSKPTFPTLSHAKIVLHIFILEVVCRSFELSTYCIRKLRKNNFRLNYF